MITIYHLGASRSERIVWLMEELGLEYRLERFQRESSGRAPAEYRALHPLGKAPLIRDGELVICESGAICEYIARRHGGGRLVVEPDAPEYARYLEWMHAAEGSVMAQLVAQLFVMRATADHPDSPVLETAKSRTEHYLRYMDNELSTRPYIAGSEFTLADIMTAMVVPTAQKLIRSNLEPYPHLLAYFSRISERPAYKKAKALAEPG